MKEYRRYILLLVLPVLWMHIVMSCSQSNDRDTGSREVQKENAEEANKDRFELQREKEEKKDADFIVDAIDRGYALIELAEIGGQQGVSQEIKDHAQQLSESQTSILTKLKTYAEDHDISIPLAGPENTRQAVENLYKEDPGNFDQQWCEQVERHNKMLMRDFEQYSNKADTSLRAVIAEAVITLRAQQEKLEGINKENGKDANQ